MSRMYNILAATDLSAPARHAVMRAALLASETCARLNILHVMDLKLMEHLRQLFGNTGENIERRLIEEVDGELDVLGAEVERHYGIRVDRRVVSGVVPDGILKQADTLKADLLIMGTRGAGFIRQLLLGSITEQVLRRATCPVLVVKQMPHEPYQRVLVPVDFSKRSASSLRRARAIAPRGSLVALHVFEIPFEGKLRYAGVKDHELNNLRNEAKKNALDQMNALVTGVALPKGVIQSLVVEGHPTHCILEQEQEQDCDLIAIGKRGYGVLQEFFLGSVTHHVLALSSCDVLVTDRSIS